MNELNPETTEFNEMVEETFRFWFIDNEHIRSPFPLYIHDKLRTLSIERLSLRLLNLAENIKKDADENFLSELFEEIIFETAMELVLNEDEKITLLYPFLPRLGDQAILKENEDESEFIIIEREILKEGDESVLNLKYQNTLTKVINESKIMLPE